MTAAPPDRSRRRRHPRPPRARARPRASPTASPTGPRLRNAAPPPRPTRGAAPPRGRVAARGPRDRQDCIPTRPPRSTRSAPAATSCSRRGPRRGSRSATSSRSSKPALAGQRRDRAAHVPDQGARPGPAPQLARVAGAAAVRVDLRRRHRPRRPRPGPQARERRAHEPRDAAHGDPAVPPALGDVPACGCATSSSTSSTPCAGSSAATSRTCCAVCAASARTTARRRRSASRARRSATRPRSPSALCGLPVEAIDDDGSPQSERAFALLAAAAASTSTPARGRPPTWRRPTSSPASSRDGHQTLAFTRSRKGSEIVAAQARRMLDERVASTGGAATVPVPRVAAYRAGYLPEERRELEHALTTASWLGVVGDERARARHRRRRARRGRRQRLPRHARVDAPAGRPRWPHRDGRRAAAVLVVGDDQLDQWYAAPPRRAARARRRGRGREPVEPVRAAAPGRRARRTSCRSSPADAEYFGDGLDDAVRDLVLDDLLKPRERAHVLGGARAARAAGRPALRVQRRVRLSVDDDGRRRSASSTRARIFNVAHPGALYLHQGRQYRVEELDTEYHRRAGRRGRRRRRAHPDPREHRHQDRRRPRDRSRCGAGVAHLGMVEVTNQVVAYQRKRTSTNELIDVVDLDLPPQSLTTSAVLVHGPDRGARRRRRRARTGCSARCTRPSTR